MINNAPIIPNAVMLDEAIGEIQQALAGGLPWLDAAFGRAQKLVKEINGRRITTPNVYCGGLQGYGNNDYIEVSPDSFKGNFCFFVVDDPQTIGWEPNAEMEQRAPFSIIFWFDLRRVFGSLNNRNTEYLKAQILDILNGRSGWLMRNGSIRINKCYEQAANIYRGFSLDECDNQFLMHPFAGFRFEVEIRIETPCVLPDLNR